MVVGQRRDPPVALRPRIVRVEDRAREEQDVGEDGAEDAHRQHVGDPAQVAEPARARQRPEHGHPHQQAEAEEADVLERVQPRGAERRLSAAQAQFLAGAVGRADDLLAQVACAWPSGSASAGTT